MSQRSRYVLVSYMIARDEREPISPGTVARKLDRLPAAATEMLQRLEAEGLLTYEPYYGVPLTDGGRNVGSDLLEKSDVLLRFFVT
ncbi:metal-dependent transcriptional regulator [Halostagnicola sp. A-GB9-2]|uniref:metal-dependent transcriptional regulator n=1 Tax=Halostagnicola sp. A-GB9-2 TaxID=3048066 RepID=UPI0024BF5A72|nr:metal-dependent transcriptional regulator [Halostagnicola sp. A-GB9-2]MDJ1433098.1 metal-dependent transcriptional regulator [Halostagnicola sp. A-GB9-2]